MSVLGSLVTTSKLLLTLEDRIAALAGRLERLEAREGEFRDRLVRVESILEVAMYNGQRRVERD